MFDSYKFNPSTGRDLAAEYAVLEDPIFGRIFVGLVNDEPEAVEVSAEVFLEGLGAVSVMFEAAPGYTSVDFRDDAAEQLDIFDADEEVNLTKSLVIGPLIIPAERRQQIVSVSIRDVDEAEAFGVHQFSGRY